MPSIDVKLAEATWVSKEVQPKEGADDQSSSEDTSSPAQLGSEDVVLTIKVRCEDGIYQLSMPAMSRDQAEDMVDDLIASGKVQLYFNDEAQIKSIFSGKVQYLVTRSRMADPTPYVDLEND